MNEDELTTIGSPYTSSELTTRYHAINRIMLAGLQIAEMSPDDFLDELGAYDTEKLQELAEKLEKKLEGL